MYARLSGSSVENFAKSYQFTIQALIAFGTWVAVITSLRMAQLARRSYLKVRVVMASVMIPTTKGTYQVTDEKRLSVALQNVGIVPIYISGSAYEWYFPWPAKVRSQQWPPGAKPFSLMPGRAETIQLTKDLAEMAKEIESLRMSNKFPRFLTFLIRFRVIADDGRVFRAKLTRKTIETIMNFLPQTS